MLYTLTPGFPVAFAIIWLLKLIGFGSSGGAFPHGLYFFLVVSFVASVVIHVGLVLTLILAWGCWIPIIAAVAIFAFLWGIGLTMLKP